MLGKVDFAGNPYLGVFCAANDRLLVASRQIPRKDLSKAEKILGVRAVQSTLGGSTVIGAVLVMNSNAAIVTNFTQPEEVASLQGMEVHIIDHRLNAVGNNILVNDQGGICHPGYDQRALKELEDFLGVELVRGTLGRMKTVGSAGVANNRGAICHPLSTVAELRLVEEVMRVKAVIATANYGIPQLGACVVANDRGAIVGTPTTPIELGRIEEGLQLY